MDMTAVASRVTTARLNSAIIGHLIPAGTGVYCNHDELIGLKENIIIGHLIPAGTGVYRNHDIDFEVDMTPTSEEQDVFAERARELFPGIEEEAEHTPAD